ncbi:MULTISPECIES: peroxide stress protein YaaA [unclassified Francisella]|uniref:peroxide stress protein YaaA n=1 Tax=unclassified Francisella TaxID=2610885 RepID=UPI002E31FF0C|nr:MULTISPECIES: peroxide stress protein YaaA [unclassified Francisella]MED7819690.1 peroxide stress protein YaaA [Francisella sp. 19S2-4]MED7830488.1 peroxide stress protein YaaA [Francisella sp. 19S2-10]
MIIVISPAKSQNFDSLKENYDFTQPIFKDQINLLINKLKHYEVEEIEKLMKISPKLAQEVFDKHNSFNPEKYNNSNSKAAIFTFSGDVYKGLNAESLDSKTINYAQDHLLMLSGLYGLIRPLDLIQAYRLEMGTKIKIDGQILYKYWQDKITPQLNDFFTKQKNKTLINLASNEYSQAIDKKNLSAKWLDIDFKENKNGSFKTIGIYAKKARGLMTRFILENQIEDIHDIKKFNIAGYKFNQDLSKDDLFCFTR